MIPKSDTQCLHAMNAEQIDTIRYANSSTGLFITYYYGISRFVFTGNDPRQGWRTPLNNIIYSEQRDEETGYGYFGARYLDHELMTMWLSVDPLADKYPSISPYAYCAWNPVKLVDPDGKDIWILTDKYNPNAPRVKWTENGLFNEDGSKYEGSNNFVEQTALALNAIYEDNQMLLSQFLGSSKYDVAISETSGATAYHESIGGTEKYGYSLQKEQSIIFNPTMGLAQCKGNADNEEYSAPFLCLLHEFGHAYNAVTDYKGYSDRKNTKTSEITIFNLAFFFKNKKLIIGTKNI